MEPTGIVLWLLDHVLRRGQRARAQFESVEVKPCDSLHLPLVRLGDNPMPEAKGPWHFDIDLRVWNPGERATAIQNVAVSVGKQRFEPGDYGAFKPTTLEPGGTKQQLWFRAYPDDESFVPDWSSTIDGTLQYQLSDGRWRKHKVNVSA
jgi:hypothetical protein